jgi:hypothetical protein
MHFVIILGVIAYTLAVEEGVAHPEAPLAVESRLALALGLLLFVGGMALAIRRAANIVLLPRIFLIIGTSIFVLAVGGVPAAVSLGIALAGILLVAILEQRSLELIKVEAIDS